MSLSSSVTEKVAERWDGIAAKFAALQQREKILLAAGVLLSVYLVWELAFAGDLNKRRDALVKRFEAANVQLKTLSTSIMTPTQLSVEQLFGWKNNCKQQIKNCKKCRLDYCLPISYHRYYTMYCEKATSSS